MQPIDAESGVSPQARKAGIQVIAVQRFSGWAWSGHPSQVSPAPAPIQGPGGTVAVAANDGSFSVEAYAGQINLGTLRPKASEQFPLTHRGRVSVRIPARQSGPEGQDQEPGAVRLFDVESP